MSTVPVNDTPGDPRGVTAELFRNVIGHFATGVTVLTAVHEGIAYGTTASAVSSLSLEPPMLLACMNRSSATGTAMALARRFVVNILAEDHAELARTFAKPAATAADAKAQFAGVRVRDGKCGPLLLDALATLECRIVEEAVGGTHTVFLAEVDSASARPGAPLAYWRGRFGRLILD